MMENEINSQVGIIENLIKRYIVNYCVMLDIPHKIKRIVFVASGSSYNAALYGKYFFENIAHIECQCEYACEVANGMFENFDSEALYIFISQSGNSIDTIDALDKVKETGAKTLCITNNPVSSIYTLCDYKFNVEAQEEMAIAATKTFSASVFMLWIIALKAAQDKNIDTSEEMKDIYLIDKTIQEAMNNIDNLDVAVNFIAKQSDFSICGFNYNYPLAREAALKIKETSYINTSSYPMGEFIHGHFALLNKSKVFLTFVMDDATSYEHKILKKILSTYKTKSIVISDNFDDKGCDILVKLQKAHSKIASIMNLIIAVQILAFKVALKLKRNIDKPAGLNKVVDNKG